VAGVSNAMQYWASRPIRIYIVIYHIISMIASVEAFYPILSHNPRFIRLLCELIVVAHNHHNDNNDNDNSILISA
jgi:hypothetical protein